MVSLCHMTKYLNFCIKNIIIIDLYKFIMYVLKINLNSNRLIIFVGEEQNLSIKRWHAKFSKHIILPMATFPIL
jgi:hypothetical protein